MWMDAFQVSTAVYLGFGHRILARAAVEPLGQAPLPAPEQRCRILNLVKLCIQPKRAEVSKKSTAAQSSQSNYLDQEPPGNAIEVFNVNDLTQLNPFRLLGFGSALSVPVFEASTLLFLAIFWAYFVRGMEYGCC